MRIQADAKCNPAYDTSVMCVTRGTRATANQAATEKLYLFQVAKKTLLKKH